MDGIVISNLSVYSDKQEVLKNVSLNAEEGEIYALLGKPDRAKRTLLRLAHKYFEEKAAYIESNSVPEEANPEDCKLLSMRPFGFMRVDEYFCYLFGLEPRKKRKEKCRACLRTAGLESKARARIDKLGATELKLLDIAIALYRNPQSLIIDADDLEQDRSARAKLNRCLSALRSEGKTVLVGMDVKHVGEGVDKVGVLSGGVMAAEGTQKAVSSMFSQSVYSIKSSLSVGALKEKFSALKAADRIEISGKTISVFTKDEEEASLDIMRVCSENRVAVKKLSLRIPTLSESVDRLTGGAKQ